MQEYNHSKFGMKTESIHIRIRDIYVLLTVQQAELLPKTVVVSRSFRSRSLISHKGPYPVLLPHIHYLLTHPALYPIRFYNFLPERNTTRKDRGRTVGFARCLKKAKERISHCFVCGSWSTRRWPR